MSKIFLNQDELDTKIDSFLSRKNYELKTKRRKAKNTTFKSVRVDIRRDRALVAL